MIKVLALVGLLVLAVGPQAAASTDVEEPYDLLFRNGTLDAIEPGYVIGLSPRCHERA